MKIKIMAWLMVCSICMASVPIPGQIKAEETVLPQQEEETEVLEVSDLESFQEAVMLVTEEDDLASPENPWKNKRLLVKSEETFDSMGAESIIQGYDQMFILDYATEEEAKTAYKALSKMQGLTVEADSTYGKTAEEREAERKQDEGNPPTKNYCAGNLSDMPDSRDILVAVIDSGYDIKSYSKLRVTDGTDLTGANTIQDENGHGTAMANIILDHTQDCVKVMPVKAADENGYTSALKIYLGIRYAIEHGADIINISMSAYKASGSEVVRAAICEAKQAGVFVVVSAGNAGCDVKDFSPANVEEAIVVSAVCEDEKIAAYSNYGANVDYCSYGNIQVFGLGGKETKQEGTSVSAAIVSAVAAEEKAYKNEVSCEELTAILNKSAKDLGETGKDGFYGNGLLLPKSIQTPEKTESSEKPEILTCDWKNIPTEELNRCIGNATHMERKIFLDQLSEADRKLLLSRNTLFSENVIYSENSFDAEGNTTETFRIEGTLYDIVMDEKVFDKYEVQAQKYHIFAYGSNTGTRSCIKLDTAANKNPAIVYCWMKDHSTDDQNSGEYGITFISGSSAYDFSKCTHKIENCDTADSGNPVVWRLKIRKVKISKPEDMVVNYSADLWNKSTYKVSGTTESGFKEHYWYVFNYQVQPASDAARQNAYGDGRWHGGFWDLGDADGKKCGNTTVTATVDIGSRDLYTSGNRDGITYRLPLKSHTNTSDSTMVTDTESTCTAKGAYHVEAAYKCTVCDKTWKTKSGKYDLPQLAHSFAEKKADSNGMINGMYLEECTKDCGGYDVNGAYWQRNIKYLQPIRYWEMNTDGSYNASPSGIDRGGTYYAAGVSVPQWSRTPSEEFQTGTLAGFLAPANAEYHDVYIPRKSYTVIYDGNGADDGKTPSQKIYCGEAFDLRKNGFCRVGYQFKGWSKTKTGETINGKAVKNLSLAHGAEVVLYAQWEPEIFKITLDGQGANIEKGTQNVYVQYAGGYYQNAAAVKQFENGKIVIPQKEIQDNKLLGGVRRQKFLGYYTESGGKGYQMIQKDGSLIADINSSGKYRYFTKDSKVYAKWENMYAVSFCPNLTAKDLEIIGKDKNGISYEEPVICPYVRWKEKGKSITVSYAEAIVKNENFSNIYRFLGWSLTPEIKSEDELILNEDKRAYTFTADEDVTLYAQWDTSFQIAYMGNEPSGGKDFLDLSDRITDEYVFCQNPFVKTIQKPAADIVTGQMENEAGEPYMETIPYSFQGWSIAKEKDEQDENEVFLPENESYESAEIILAARDTITFGAPASDFYAADAGYASEKYKKVPFVNMYAVWDQYPQIQAADIYLPLSDAKDGILTEEYLLGLAAATDEELKSDANTDGRLKNGEDTENGTSFTIQDYQMEDFIGADAEMSLTITYRAKDQAGNVTTKMVRVYLVDTAGKEYDVGKVRFISAEYTDTLDQNSIWRSGEYARKLDLVLGNKKTGEEYTAVTPIQKALGIKPVLKPGSGKWDHVQQIWEFPHEEVASIQAYVEAVGVGGDASGFLEKFGHCRVQ